MKISLAGTDATHAEHIEKIKSRMYVGLQNGCHFVPGELGMGLVEGYDNMGYPMSKPHLRAELEADLKRICEGTKDPKVVLTEQLAMYKEVFQMALQQVKCSVVTNVSCLFVTILLATFRPTRWKRSHVLQSVSVLMKLR
jgi:DNA topoisomerase IA